MSLKSTLESSDKIAYELYLTGLTEDTVRKISAEQKEPQRMLTHRLKCLEILKKQTQSKSNHLKSSEKII